MTLTKNWQIVQENSVSGSAGYLSSSGSGRASLSSSGSSSLLVTQYVWGLRGVDDVVLRDLSGSATQRLYALRDVMHVTAILSSRGAVLERYNYDAYGNTRVNGTSSNVSFYGWGIRFCSYLFDQESGFYQVRNRYLHPFLGGWINRDPLPNAELSQGNNLYWYVGNNPGTRNDELGLLSNSSASTNPYTAPNSGGEGNVTHTKLTLQLQFNQCCDCSQLLKDVNSHLKSFDLWKQNSVADLSISGNIGSFTPLFIAQVAGIFALNDWQWQVLFSYDNKNNVMIARTLNNHSLVGVRVCYASSKLIGKNCLISINTESYDQPRGIVNWLGSPLGRYFQDKIWEDYFGNIAKNYKKLPCFLSDKEIQSPPEDTGSTNNPWI